MQIGDLLLAKDDWNCISDLKFFFVFLNKVDGNNSQNSELINSLLALLSTGIGCADERKSRLIQTVWIDNQQQSSAYTFYDARTIIYVNQWLIVWYTIFIIVIVKILLSKINYEKQTLQKRNTIILHTYRICMCMRHSQGLFERQKWGNDPPEALKRDSWNCGTHTLGISSGENDLSNQFLLLAIFRMFFNAEKNCWFTRLGFWSWEPFFCSHHVRKLSVIF